MKVLLLGGTAEARALATRLDRDGRIDLTVSLAGATRVPAAIEGTVRVGGFGGEAAQAAYLREGRFDAVIDATHPFATRISQRTQAICARMAVPYVLLLRSAWEPEACDDWRVVTDESGVAAQVRGAGNVFLGTGPGSVEAIGPLPVERVLCRRIDPPQQDYPHDNGDWVLGRPPFSVEDEVAFFQAQGVDLIVTKNAGGQGGWAKVEAARTLGLPVVMVARPATPPGEVVDSVTGALDWIERL